MDVKRVKSIVLGYCTLHNILCDKNQTVVGTQVDQEDTDTSVGVLKLGSWRKDEAEKTWTELKKIKGNTSNDAAKKSPTI